MDWTRAEGRQGFRYERREQGCGRGCPLSGLSQWRSRGLGKINLLGDGVKGRVTDAIENRDQKNQRPWWKLALKIGEVAGRMRFMRISRDDRRRTCNAT
jgi:hypothetical protein